MSTHKAWNIIWIFLISFFLQLIFFWLRGGYITILGLTGFPLSMIVFFIAYFIATVWLMKKYREILPAWSIITAILIGTSCLELPLRIFHAHNSLISLPDLIMRFLAVIAGIGYSYMGKRTAKIALVICSGLFAIWSSYFGFDLWLNKLDFGTFTGKTEQVVEFPVVFQAPSGQNIALTDFKGKYLILDFWNSTCGICFQEFPKVETLYNQIKGRKDAELYSVFCRIAQREETTKTGADIITEKGYTFPTISLDNRIPGLNAIGITCFPTVVIFNPDGKMIFRGRVDGAKNYMEKLLKSDF